MQIAKNSDLIVGEDRQAHQFLLQMADGTFSHIRHVILDTVYLDFCSQVLNPCPAE